MAFDSLPPIPKAMAESAYRLFTSYHGRSGFKENTEIDRSINWKPTFTLNSGISVTAVEVSESLFPRVLHFAANDIIAYSQPIVVYSVCPLSAYQADRNLHLTRQLQELGIGLVTVDDRGDALRQFSCPPMAEHISETLFREKTRELSGTWSRPFKSAYETYKTNAEQGLQEASQVVEHAIRSLARIGDKRGFSTAKIEQNTAGQTVRELERVTQFASCCTSIAAAKAFVANYRNPSSHVPRNAREAKERVQMSRSGFLQALVVTHGLITEAKTAGFVLKSLPQ